MTIEEGKKIIDKKSINKQYKIAKEYQNHILYLTNIKELNGSLVINKRTRSLLLLSPEIVKVLSKEKLLRTVNL